MAGETLTDVFSDIADAVRAKGVTGQMTPLQMPSKITSIPSGGETPEAEWKDVNFIDYDGKNLYSYTTAEALALTELPPAPDRTSKGLTFQEWNYTLEEVKENASDTGKCIAGATYTTTDGKTHIKITIRDEYNSNIPLCFSQSVSEGVEVDWGDGSTPQTDSSGSGWKTLWHKYNPDSYPASYDISMAINEGQTLNLIGVRNVGTESSTNPSTMYQSVVDEMYFGNKCYPNDLSNYRNLKILTFNKDITLIVQNGLSNLNSLRSLTLPRGLLYLQGKYYGAYNLKVVSSPNNSPSTSGQYSNTPIKYVFIRYVGNDFCNGCHNLVSVALKNEITYISNSSFKYCDTLAQITLPSSVTGIGTYAFDHCYGLQKLDCSKCNQVPTLANTNALQDTNANLKIIVPDALYDDWIVATNWSTYASKIVKASEA